MERKCAGGWRRRRKVSREAACSSSPTSTTCTSSTARAGACSKRIASHTPPSLRLNACRLDYVLIAPQLGHDVLMERLRRAADGFRTLIEETFANLWDAHRGDDFAIE